jgi:hypothetical protein
MPSTLVVIPTIKGREESLKRTLDAYLETDHDLDIHIVADCPTCGIAWDAGLHYAIQKGGFDYIHLSADDLVPHDGWLDAAIPFLERDVIPMPKILNPDGTLFSFGHWNNTVSVVPIFPAKYIDRILPMFTGQYYTDNHVSDSLKLPHELCEGYTFTHYLEKAGRGAGMDENERMIKDKEDYDRWMH